MKKLITLCLSALLAVGCAFAAPPARKAPAKSSPRPEGKRIVVNTKAAVRMNSRSNSAGVNVDGFANKARLASSLNVSKAPARVGDSGSTIYGCIYVDETGTYPASIAEVYTDGAITPLITLPAGPSGGDLSVNVIYVRDGKMHCLAQEIFWGMFLLGNYEFVYDLETGELVSQTPYGEEDIMFNYAAYDPVNDMLYGYVMTQSAMYYCTAPAETPRAVTPVAQMPEDALTMVSLTYNQVDGKVMGVSGVASGGKVVEISTVDGSQTVVGAVADPSKYATGFCYSPLDEAYVYLVCTDDACAVQMLDENDFSVISSTPYNGFIEISGLYCPDNRKISPSAPGEATLVNTIFGNGALSGTLTYRLPSVTHGGSPILGDVDWVLYVDNKEVKRGSGAAGSEVAVTVSDLKEGNHTFKFVCALGGNQGKYILSTFYVGNDTPKAPADVTLTADKISWTPVTEGIHGGYVNAEEVTYNVYLNDELIASGIKDVECAPNLPVGELVESYVASVEALFDGKVSEKASSNDIKYGEPYSIPENFEPTPKEAENFTIVDSNADGNAITFMMGNFGEGFGEVPVFYYNYSSTKDADDWLFLPVTKYDDVNAVYEFSMNAFRTDDGYTEELEVALCTAPEAGSAVKTLKERFELTNAKTEGAENIAAALSTYTTVDFTIPSAGNYYIGIHVVSPADQFRTFMRDFSVKKVEGITIANPQAVSGLSAVAAPGGALNAAVTFTFPAASIDGVEYDAAQALVATVQAEGCDAVTANGKPGETVTITVPTKQGDNTITVTVKDGDKTGLPATVSVYTGVERPGTVGNLAAEVDASDYTAHLTWDAPAEGVDGGYVASTGIKYYLCEYVNNGLQSGWMISEEIGTDVFEYDYTIPEGTAQSLVRLGIIAENFVGMADYLTSTSAVMGMPYATPVSVVCSGQSSLLMPVVSYGSGWSLKIGDPSTAYEEFKTDDNLAGLFPQATSDMDVTYSLPKFSTKNTTNPAIRLNTYGGSTSEFSVSVAAYGIDSKVVKTFKASDFTEKGPQDVVVDLGSEFAGKEWIEISLTSHVSDTETFILYGYKVYDNIPYDFGVYAIEGPSDAKIGEEAKYVAHVLNYGNTANTMPASGWKLADKDGNVIADVSVPAGTESLAPDAEVTFDIAFTPTAEQIGELTLTYTIEKADAKEYNDSMTKEITVTKGLVPVVTDLTAKEISYDNVTLAWTPVVPAGGDVESFEEETPFLLDDVTDMVAGFKRVDGDGLKTYGSQAEGFANIPGAYGPASFLCYNKETVDEALGGSGTFEPKTGSQFLIAFCPAEGPDGSSDIAAADDWLISPEVETGSDFSLSLRPITYKYGPEIVEIMYSTTGDKPEDFKVLETLKVGEGMDANTPTVYEDYTFTLPAGAKYFAIHYVSVDVFGIMIDDIMYSPVGSGLKLSGYDIYRDGSVIDANVPCGDGTYDDSTVEENKQYTYMVVPVLSDGTKGLDSNSLTIRTTGVEGVTAGSRAVYAVAGAIIVNGYEGEAVAIASADGKVVARSSAANASERYSLTSGVYVVKAGKDLYKLIVK